MIASNRSGLEEALDKDDEGLNVEKSGDWSTRGGVARTP